MLAMSCYCAKDYEAASQYFKKYYTSYPKGIFAEMAAFYVGQSLYMLTPEPRLGTDYGNLVLAGDKLYGVLDGKASASTLISIDKDGAAKRIRPFSSRTGKLVADNVRRRIYWSEKLTDRRWSMAGNTIIRYFEFDSPKRQYDLTSEGRLYNPAPSPDGNTVAVTSYPVDGGSRLVVLSADDGSVIWESECPGFQLTESTWHNGLIYGLGIADSGGFGIIPKPCFSQGFHARKSFFKSAFAIMHLMIVQPLLCLFRGRRPRIIEI